MKISNLNSNEDVLQEVASWKNRQYLLLDGARFDNVHAFIYRMVDFPEHYPLYLRTYFSSALDAGPWLLTVPNGKHDLITWFVKIGADNRQALLIESKDSIQTLVKHFQKFLEVKLPSMQIVLFRFYDPDIFDALIQTDCRERQVMIEPFSNIIWKTSDGFFQLLNCQSCDGDIYAGN
jgi:hypothetical protein